MLAAALGERTTKGGMAKHQSTDLRTPSPFAEGALSMLAKLEKKVGNIVEFELAEVGTNLIKDA